MEFIDVILAILNVVIVLLTLFLIGIILIQRGKGGGLAGAFGGVGGSSAFGTKTGDVFTKITVGVAIAWILLSMLMVVLTNRRNVSAWGDDPRPRSPRSWIRRRVSRRPRTSQSRSRTYRFPRTSPGAQADRSSPAIPDIPLPAESPEPVPK